MNMSEDQFRYFIPSVEETKAILDVLTCDYRSSISELSERSLAVKDIKVKLSVEIVSLEIEGDNGLNEKHILKFFKNRYKASDNLND